MRILASLVIIALIATPALARYSQPRVNKNAAPACTPSSDPNVAPCGVKDEAPVYFPEKLNTPQPAAKATTTDTETTKKSKKVKGGPSSDAVPPPLPLPLPASH